MKICDHDPDSETRYVCLKHGITMCEKCLRCRDPEIYCKHRYACAIHFLTRRKGSLEDAPLPRETPGRVLKSST